MDFVSIRIITVARARLPAADPGGPLDSRAPIVVRMPSEGAEWLGVDGESRSAETAGEPGELEDGMRFVGAHELRARLSIVSRQRVYQLARRPDFPAPVAVLAQGKVWLLSEVDEWIRRHRAGGGAARLGRDLEAG